MKVIAQIPGDRVLVSLTLRELANVLGEYSQYDLKREVINELITKDTEVQISDIYDKHYLISEFQSSDKLNDAREKLEKLLRALTPIESKVSDLALLTQKKTK